MSPSTDKDYTMGVTFDVSGAWIRNFAPPLTGLNRLTHFESLKDRLCQDTEDCEAAFDSYTIQLGVSAFTPRKGDTADCGSYGCVLGDTRPIYNDRPYASLLYVTMRRTTGKGRNAFTSDLTVGVLGLQIAKNVQTWIHDRRHDVRPAGWPNQVSDGFEPTMKYRLAIRRLLWDVPHDPTLDFRILDLTPDAEASVGYYINAAMGGRLRFGLIRTPFWSTERRPVGPTRARFPPLPRQPRGDGEENQYENLDAYSDLKAILKRLFEVYVWISGGGELWGYNALLQGQFRSSNVRLRFRSTSDPMAARLRRFVGDYQWGLTLGIGPASVAYQHNTHSALFGGPFSRSHSWGGIYLTCRSGG